MECGMTVVEVKPIVPPGETGVLGGTRCIIATLMGPYELIRSAYEQLFPWARAKGHTPKGPCWELYITDPTKEPDSSKWITEIYLPI